MGDQPTAGLRPAAFFACAALLAALAAWWTLSRTFDNWRAPLDAMIAGTADKPFVFRRLAPAAISLMAAPARAIAGDSPADLPAVASFLARARMPREQAPEALALAAFVWLCFAAYPYALRMLGGAFWRRGVALDAVALAGLPAALPLLDPLYAYDPATLPLMAWALAAMARSGWVAYLGAFALFTIHRETSFLLALAFAPAAWRAMPGRQLAGMLAAQAAIWLAWKAACEWRFAGNPGGTVEIHIWQQANFVGVVQNLKALAFVPFAAAAFAEWPRLGRELRGALALLLPMACLYAVFGFPGEFRVFLEWMPAATLAAGACAWRLARRPMLLAERLDRSP